MTSVLLAASAVLLTGCRSAEYRDARFHGQSLMIGERYGAARRFFKEADNLMPRRVENLHDLGTCSLMLAKKQFEQNHHAAAMREVEAAIAYFSEAIDVHPGHQASIEGKTTALKLKGQFDAALKHAEWAAEFVGPSARQFLYLARELEERGDIDGALLRYKQAVATEPDNADAHITFAKFLLKTNNEEAALYHLQAAYRLQPTNPWVLQQLSTRGAVPTLANEAKPKP